jgi:hypothetical protein
MLWTLIITVAVIVLPLIGLPFAIPMFLSVYNVFGFLAARQAPYPAPAPQRVRKTVRDGGMTELAATRQFAAAFCGPERTPCSS